jgi:hypothetical protein
MLKQLAALRVIHDFPELLYFRVGGGGSTAELLEEDFSCFTLLVHLVADGSIGGLTGRLLGG